MSTMHANEVHNLILVDRSMDAWKSASDSILLLFTNARGDYCIRQVLITF